MAPDTGARAVVTQALALSVPNRGPREGLSLRNRRLQSTYWRTTMMANWRIRPVVGRILNVGAHTLHRGGIQAASMKPERSAAWRCLAIPTMHEGVAQ
jgi:hypothetical protein